MDTLAYIARASRSITDATNRWRFIETLCATSGDLACVRRVAGQLKQKLSPAPARTPGVRVRQHGDGLATLRVTGPALSHEALPAHPHAGAPAPQACAQAPATTSASTAQQHGAHTPNHHWWHTAFQ